MDIFSIDNFNDTVQDLPILRAMLRECCDELDKIVYSVATGTLRNDDARYPIYYLTHERTCLKGRIALLNKEKTQ